jgi:ATP-dependent DNA helicase RecQ
VDALAKAARLSGRRTDQVVGRLEELGLARVEPDGLVQPNAGLVNPNAPEGASLEAVADEVVEAQERRRRHARSRVELLRGYAETAACRGRYLLNALGEELDGPCGHCDNDAAEAEADLEAVPFRLGDAVVHATFGPGQVSRVEVDRVVVRFESVGYRTLALDAVLEPGLLAKASS